jgi:PAS domain S-box-containing protein
MPPIPRARYGIAVVSVALAVGLRRLLDPAVGDEFPFATLFFAVTFCAWYGGFGPALLAVLLGAITSDYFLLPPRGSFGLHGRDQQVGMGLYVAVGAGIALLGGEMRRAEDRARANSAAERGQRDRLRVTLESIGDAVIVTDAGGRVTLLNPAARALTGWAEAEAAGVPLADVFNVVDEGTGRAAEGPVTRVLREGAVVGLGNHTVLIARDGTRRPIEDSGAPIRGESGAVAGVVLVFRDVGERRRAERAVRAAEARFRALVEQSIAGLYVIQDDRFAYVNPTMAAIFGCTAAELTSRPVFDWIHPEDRDRARENVRRRLDGTVPSVRYDLRMYRRDGAVMRVEVHGTRAEHDGRPAILGVLLDVSERYAAEEEVRRLTAGLEARVRERTAELEAANKELEAFAYSVSHDLRAPLRAIDGFARIVLQDFAAALPAEAQEYLADVRRNALRMGRLVDDLLAFSRLGRQALRVRPVAMADLVRECLGEIRPPAGADVRVAALPPAQGDPGLLKQVWLNLLGNALKYAGKRDRPVVEVGAAGGPTYFVRDNGVGFDMRYAGKLFGVFQRLHKAEEYEGTGVGLAIVQRIVLRHGGRVWAEAAPDAGATFFFCLSPAGSAASRGPGTGDGE